MTAILNSLMSGGYVDDIPRANDYDPNDGYEYNPDEEDRRKEWLENYAAEAAGIYEHDELPL